ncbi:MAG: hypothetical protein JW801_11290 [Bacteroidales bacterium]|nr:hypothetical protein [Bacteroidales bacterium]
MKRLFYLVFVLTSLFAGSSLSAQEFLIRDEVHTYTDADCGFYWWYDMSSYPENWVSPVDYWNGTIQLRVEILSQPTNTPAKFSFILWDACSGATGELAGMHTLVGSGSPRVGTSSQRFSDYYTVNGGIDMSNAGVVSKMAVDVRTESGTSISCPAWGYPDYPWSARANWFPMQVRFTVVAVASGAGFSGWGNYTSSAPVHGTSTGPADPSTCRENWSSGSCDPEFIADSPTPSSLVVEAESMTLSGYFVQGLMGASNGNVAGLWSPSAQSTEGTLSMNFPHASGQYDIRIVYLDENDGASDFSLLRNGSAVDSWSGVEQSCQNAYSVRTIANQALQMGDLLTIQGYQSAGAYAKVDYIDFIPLGSPPASLRIMPLGTSLTFDQYVSETRPVGDRGGYRQFLYSMLNSAGLDFDFVGSESSGQNIFPDYENAGFPGITAPQLLHLLRTGYNQTTATRETSGYYLDVFQPGLIILEIGTNGFTTSVETLDSILTEIDKYKLRTGIAAKTILAQIINRNPVYAPVSDYNANIAGLVAGRADVSVLLVDLENDAGLIYATDPDGDMHDQFHPSLKGYAKIAQLLVDEVLRSQGMLSAAPIFLTTNSIVSPALGEAFYYDAHAAAGVKPVYSLSGAPSGVTVDPQLGVVEWPSSLSGSHNFQLLANNASGQGSESISLNINSSSTTGYESIMPLTVTNGNRRAQAVVMPESGTIQSMSMYHGAGSGNALFAVYADNSGFPGDLLGVTSVFAVDGTTGWQTEYLTAPAAVTAGQTVWLAWVYENPPVLYYGSGSPGRATTNGSYASGMPLQFGTSTVAEYQYSIYCSYAAGEITPTPPGAPINLTAIAGANQVSLSWEHSGVNILGFTLERSTGGGAFSSLADIAASERTYIDNSVSAPGDYAYRVSAYNATGNSGFSNETSVILSTDPPLSLTAGNTSVFELLVYNANRRAMQVTIPAGGLLSSISMYHGPVSGNVRYAVYSDNGGSPDALLGITPVTPAAPTTDWQSINLASPIAVTGGQKVWLAWVYEYSTPIYYTAGIPGRASSDQTWSGGMPSAFGSFTVSDYVYSIYATVQTQSLPEEAPVAPTGLDASLSGASTVDLSWTDASLNEENFVLERMETGGSYAVITSLPANTQSYTDNVPSIGTGYSYRILAGNSFGQSGYSNEAAVEVPFPSEEAVAGFQTVFGQVVYNANRRAQRITMPENGSLTQISMYHGPGSGNVRYAVYSDNGGYPAQLLGETGLVPLVNSSVWQTETLLSPVVVTAGQSVWLAWVYEYPPQLFYESGGEGRANSADTWGAGMPADFGTSTVTAYRYSIYASYVPGSSGVAPAAPESLSYTYDALTPAVQLSWSDNASNEDNFLVERAVNGGDFSLVSTLPANSNSYTDGDIAYLNDYEYRIRAYNSYGYSGYSNTISLTATEVSASPITVGHDILYGTEVYSGFRRAQQVSIPVAGQLTSVSMYHGAASGKLLYGVYSDLGGQPDQLLGTTDPTPVSGGTGWQEVALLNPVNVTAGEAVWLAWVYEFGAPVYYTSGTPGRAHTDDYYMGSLPLNFNPVSTADYIYSIYATLVPAAAKSAEQDLLPQEELSFRLFPNPVAGDEFYILPEMKYDENELTRIELISATGKLLQVEERLPEAMDAAFVLKGYPVENNLLFVRITVRNQVFIRKLAVIRL